SPQHHIEPQIFPYLNNERSAAVRLTFHPCQGCLALVPQLRSRHAARGQAPRLVWQDRPRAARHAGRVPFSRRHVSLELLRKHRSAFPIAIASAAVSRPEVLSPLPAVADPCSLQLRAGLRATSRAPRLFAEELSLRVPGRCLKCRANRTDRLFSEMPDAAART